MNFEFSVKMFGLFLSQWFDLKYTKIAMYRIILNVYQRAGEIDENA